MNGYLLTLVIVLIVFVVIAMARLLAHQRLPHPRRLPAGNDADDRGDPGQGDENRS